MINLRNSPFLWMAVILLITYAIGENFIPRPALFVLILLAIGLLGSALMACMSYAPKRYLWSTAGISLVIVFAGCLHREYFTRRHFPTPLLDSSCQVVAVVEVAEVLKVKPNRITLRCYNRSIRSSVDSIAITCDDSYILVQLRDPDSIQLLPGDQLQVKGWLSAIAPAMNPHSFDMRKYYKTLVIRHQLAGKASDASIYTNHRNTIQRLTARWQRNLSSIVKSHTSPASAQVINALVWGDRSDMAEDVRDAFADSGAMHVLSVSGMHVAMIYSLLMLILGAPGEGTFIRRLIRFILYAAAILLYVGLTGACPAVVRAGLMILLYLFGKSMGWNTQVWNLIGFAAFMMLWINPLLYYNVGFQLSFLAMAGLLLYAKPIMRSVACKYKLAHWTWEVVAMSLAAQVFILPVILGQFHQFPLTFIASSIVAIPAGYIVIFGAILNVILSIVHIDFLWPVLDHSCIWFVDCMKWMAGLNPSMHYSLPLIASIALTTISLLYSFALVYRWPIGKQVTYSCCGLLMIFFIQHRFIHWNKNEIIVYHNFSGLTLDVFQDGNVYNIHDTKLTPSQLDFPARGYRCHKDIIDVKSIQLEQEFVQSGFSYHDRILKVGSASMLLYSQKWLLPANEPITHIIIADCKDSEQLLSFLQQHAGAHIIISASCPRKDAAKAVALLTQQGVSFYDMNSQGYFKISL
jgi:competence protein ComEC